MLELAGFSVIDRNDRIASLLKTATGRLIARLAIERNWNSLRAMTPSSGNSGISKP
jgi:hypothetical protein